MAKDNKPATAMAEAFADQVDLSGEASIASPTVLAPTIAEPSAPAPDPEIPLSLDEFCLRLSAGDTRVELIGAFHSEEAKAGKSKDVESAFSARFNDFINLPA